ncbi:NAD(P)/FAD-dependent oxidoreductase [Candidatus Nitrospira bockiana]
MDPMIDTTYLLIGGGLASSQAAETLRQHQPQAGLVLVGEERHPPYDRPPLSKEFLQGDKRAADLFFHTAEHYRERNIELILGTPVEALDLPAKIARLADGRRIRFEKALLATGGRPVTLSIPGSHLPGVHYLRTLDDATALSARAAPGARAVMIGAGFIGLEVAASLTRRGVQVTVIEMEPRIWPRFADAALAQAIQSYCADKGVVFQMGERVTAFDGADRVSLVRTQSGRTIPCDIICIGVGIRPNDGLARAAGLVVDNGIIVDEYLRSSHPDVFAAGDVANYFDPLFQKRRRVEHWGHAEYTGQLAARNMAGDSAAYDLLTYVWSDLFDLHLEFAGDESEHDQVLIRGRLGDPSSTVFYLKQHRLVAFFAVNPGGRDLPPLKRLITQRRDLTGREGALQDPQVPFKTLLA